MFPRMNDKIKALTYAAIVLLLFPLILFATFLGNIVTTSLGEELG
ncbi:hypothetical protein [Paenibacillus thiaminolyticus]|nr:hypothetical protein [Paenibacillus thiaminolyticus]